MLSSMPVLALIGTGLALSNTVAITRGLLTRDRTFQRTPKFRIERREDRWAGNRYALSFEWIVIGELLLALYALAAVGVAIAVGNYFAVPFLLLYVGGYGYVGLYGLTDAWKGRQARPGVRRETMAADSQIK
jgi:hypothetical protein